MTDGPAGYCQVCGLRPRWRYVIVHEVPSGPAGLWCCAHCSLLVWGTGTW